MRRLAVLSCVTLCLACDSANSGESGDEQACTEIGCSSSLAISLAHNFTLTEGGYRIEMDTPLHEIFCSIPAELTGSESCFGFRFSNLEWDASEIRMTLNEPFYDPQANPDALPFEMVTVRILKDGATVADVQIDVDGGERLEPNGPGCGPFCWQAVGVATLP